MFYAVFLLEKEMNKRKVVNTREISTLQSKVTISETKRFLICLSFHIHGGSLEDQSA